MSDEKDTNRERSEEQRLFEALIPQEPIRLYKEDSRRFFEALLNPPEPNEALRKLMKRKD